MIHLDCIYVIYIHSPTKPVRSHFISGLPRSGSTLLAALLRQNPRFHSAMTSPIGGQVDRMLSAMSEDNQFFVN
ncbi:sulfotransferase [Microcoleus sp.]|uniref:sulfotransferase n=1 Tax=Microcoleus sp. TaxID=44472 RepID=UPI003593930D